MLREGAVKLGVNPEAISMCGVLAGEVVKFYPRRRVMVRYQGENILTMLWFLKKENDGKN